MIVSRIIPLGFAFCLALTSLACAGNKKPPTDTGPDSGEDEGEVGDDDDDDDDDDDGGEVCSSDADCVPAQCCHPSSCVPAGQAPDCTDVVCTLECQPNTLDCDQGHCACQDGTCLAIIDNPLGG